MKRLINTFFAIAILSLFLGACQSSDKPTTEIQEPSAIVEYDSLLAKKYGADAYGMKKYVIAFLKRGPNQGLDSLQKVELQKAHMENIGKLAEEGKLVLAGPFFGNDDLRGIYIFDVESIDEAKKLTETDPAIQQQSLVMELKEWYGSAALMAVNDLHKRIAKIEI
jgi:uncharacterized protein YciI